MPMNFILPTYTAILGIAVLALVPKEEIRFLGKYALVLAVLVDTFDIIVFTKLLGIGGYKNFEPFGFMGFPLFSALAGTIYFILYLYFMPTYKPWIYIFPLLGASSSTLFSNVQVKLGIFQWNYGKVIIPFIIFLGIHIFVTLIYLRVVHKEDIKT